jgi:hypothetical protein
MAWSRFSPDELERRRKLSIEALEAIDAEKWGEEYQEVCDSIYWKFGPCCAGCDHWSSYAGLSGQCTAASIVSGADVLRSMGITWSTYIAKPGHPYTEAKHRCGLFSDTFEWSTLEADYLRRIGAMVGNQLKPRPRP